MFNNIGNSKLIIKEILSKRNHFLIFIFTAIFSFIVFYMLSVATVANQSLDIFIMMSGFWFTFSHLFLLAVISILFGIFVSMFVFKVRLLKKASSTGFFSSFGIVAGAFSAGCPMCGSVLFALFGAPLALFVMPFKGLELKVLSIALLGFSNYFLTRSLAKCKIILK